MKVINSHIVIFILVLIITIVVVSFYYLVKPENPMVVNVNPIPKVDPGNIPNINPQTNSNCKTLLDCSGKDANFCNTSCQDINKINYTCQVINNDPNSNNYIGAVYYNGKKVPNGQWCLPSFQNSEYCNQYVGKRVWSDYVGDQSWQCVNEYPQFFDAQEYLGCKDFSDQTINDNAQTVIGRQAGNKLGVKNSDGTITYYDPLTDSDFFKKWETTSPFEKNIQCQCGPITNKNGIQANSVQLPNDPYNCHLDPCTDGGVLEYGPGSSAWDPLQQTCNCDLINNASCKTIDQSYSYSLTKMCCIDSTGECAKGNTNLGNYIYVKSPFDNRCKNASVICSVGVVYNNPWDSINQRCNCDEANGYGSVLCNSNVVSRPGYPNCNDMQNALGSECQQLCQSGTNVCLRGNCTVVNNNQVCNCPIPLVNNDTSCSSKNLNNVTSYTGKDCSQQCIGAGNICSQGWTGGDCYGGCSQCCYGVSRQEWSWDNFGYISICTCPPAKQNTDASCDPNNKQNVMSTTEGSNCTQQCIGSGNVCNKNGSDCYGGCGQCCRGSSYYDKYDPNIQRCS